MQSLRSLVDRGLQPEIPSMSPWPLSIVIKDTSIHIAILSLPMKDNNQDAVNKTMKDFSTARLSWLVLPDCFHQRPAA